MQTNTNAKNIVVVEDDQKLGEQIQRFLVRHGYAVEHVLNGIDGIACIKHQQPDIVILDLMLPGADGFKVCREVLPHFHGQILMLTASEEDMDQVAGLEIGADGYLIKPVHPRVLLAHIRLLERKRAPVAASSTPQPGGKQLTFGQLNIHLTRRRVMLGNKNILLTPSEFDVLVLLAIHAEQIVSRDELLKILRGIEYDGLDRSIDVKISALRKKLADDMAQPQRIITVRSKGYLFVPDAWQ